MAKLNLSYPKVKGGTGSLGHLTTDEYNDIFAAIQEATLGIKTQGIEVTLNTTPEIEDVSALRMEDYLTMDPRVDASKANGTSSTALSTILSGYGRLDAYNKFHTKDYFQYVNGTETILKFRYEHLTNDRFVANGEDLRIVTGAYVLNPRISNVNYAFDEDKHRLWNNKLDRVDPDGALDEVSRFPVAVTGAPVYDYATGTLWLRTGTTLANYDIDGTLINSFTLSETSVTGLAYDDVDDVFWIVASGGVFKISKTGTTLSSFSIAHSTSDITYDRVTDTLWYHNTSTLYNVSKTGAVLGNIPGSNFAAFHIKELDVFASYISTIGRLIDKTGATFVPTELPRVQSQNARYVRESDTWVYNDYIEVDQTGTTVESFNISGSHNTIKDKRGRFWAYSPGGSEIKIYEGGSLLHTITGVVTTAEALNYDYNGSRVLLVDASTETVRFYDEETFAYLGLISGETISDDALNNFFDDDTGTLYGRYGQNSIPTRYAETALEHIHVAWGARDYFRGLTWAARWSDFSNGDLLDSYLNAQGVSVVPIDIIFDTVFSADIELRYDGTNVTWYKDDVLQDTWYVPVADFNGFGLKLNNKSKISQLYYEVRKL